MNNDLPFKLKTNIKITFSALYIYFRDLCVSALGMATSTFIINKWAYVAQQIMSFQMNLPQILKVLDYS